MAFEIDLQEAYKKAFGIRTPIYVAVSPPLKSAPNDFKNSEAQPSQEIDFSEVKTLKIDTSEVRSSLGTLVLSPITIQAGAYQERLDNGEIRNTSFDEFMLPPTSTVQVNFKKIVVDTPLRGGQGEFTEMIGTANADIRIKGILIGKDLKRPEQLIRRLKQLEKIPKHLGVVCDYLQWLEINYLTIRSVNLPVLEGSPSMQPFELICKSDNPTNLIING